MTSVFGLPSVLGWQRKFHPPKGVGTLRIISRAHFYLRNSYRRAKTACMCSCISHRMNPLCSRFRALAALQSRGGPIAKWHVHFATAERFLEPRHQLDDPMIPGLSDRRGCTVKP